MMNRFIRQTIAASMACVSCGAFAADGYIESSGVGTINLNHFAGPSTRVVVDFETVEAIKSSRLFGSLASEGKGGYGVYVNSSSNLGVCGGDDKTLMSLSKKATPELRYVIDLKTNGQTLTTKLSTGGEVVKTLTSNVVQTVTCAEPLTLFGECTNANGVACQRYSKMRIYGFKIWEGDRLVRDYVPCVKGTVPGLRDRETGAFVFANRSDAVTAGGDVERIGDDPSVMMPGNDGVNGHRDIDTGHYLTPETKVELDFALLEETDPTSTWYLFSGYSTDDKKSSWDTCVTDEKAWQWHVNGQSGKISGEVPGLGLSHGKGVRRTVILDAYEKKAVVLTAGHTNYVGEITTPGTSACTKYTLRVAAKFAGGNGFAPIRVYGLKISEGGELIADYRPYVQDCCAGLREVGSGNFLTSETWKQHHALEASGSAIKCNAREDAYLRSDGSQIVNLGYRANAKSVIEVDCALLRTNRNVVAFGGGVGANALFCQSYINNSSANWCFGMGKGKFNNVSASKTISYYRHVFTMDIPGKRNTISGPLTPYENEYTYDLGDVCDTGLGVFGRPTNADWNEFSGLTPMKLYSVKISEDGEVKHLYLPYKDELRTGLKDVMTGEVVGDAAGSASPLTVGGHGWKDGADDFYTKPVGGVVRVGESMTLAAYAPGAMRYEWSLDGEVVEGESGSSLSLDWKRGGKTVLVTVTPIFSVYGEEFRGTSAAAAVSFEKTGLTLLLK